MELPFKILICGGGHGALAFSAIASSKPNITVNVFSMSADNAQRWSDTLGSESIIVESTDAEGNKCELRGKPACITKDPAVAMDGVDAVFFVVPANSHQRYFEAILPYLQPNTTIVGMPGQSGFEIQAFHCLKELASKCAIVNIESLPFNCRTTEFGKKVKVLGQKEGQLTSLIVDQGNFKIPPLSLCQMAIGEKPELKLTQNYLVVNLTSKTFIHPPILYGRWIDWDGTPLPEAPLFYHSVDDIQAGYLEKVSDELVAVAQAMHEQENRLDMSDVTRYSDWLNVCFPKYFSVNLKTSLNNNTAYEGITHPVKKVDGGFVPDYTTRYMTEDIPYGLVTMKGFAQCVGVPTPTLDEIVEWAQRKLGKEYLIDGQLKGKDVKESRAPQAYGITTLDELYKLI